MHTYHVKDISCMVSFQGEKWHRPTSCSLQLTSRARCARSRTSDFAFLLCSNRKAKVEQEPLFFAPLSIVTNQEPQKTKQARNLKSSTLARMAQHHHHENLSQHKGMCPFRCNFTNSFWSMLFATIKAVPRCLPISTWQTVADGR